MKKILFFIFLFCMLYAQNIKGQENLTKQQKYVKYVAKSVGESICTGKMCFGKTLQAISWQESSFGVHLIGDNATSFGSFQIKKMTAKRVIKHYRFHAFYYLLKNDVLLVHRLIKDPRFGAIIAAYYLKMNYESGLKRNHWDPWILTVSRYNGGNFNRKYLNKIVHKIRNLS